jgi:hypothetical protein
MTYFWALLPPWIGWSAGALAWTAFGWILRGSLAAWFFFAMAGVYCAVAVISSLRRKAAPALPVTPTTNSPNEPERAEQNRTTAVGE